MVRLYSALVALSLIWGLSFVFMKWLLDPAGVWGTVFLRCSAGMIILLPLVWRQRKRLPKPFPWKALLFVGIFNSTLPWALIPLSETMIDSTTASVLNATTPIWTAIVGTAFFALPLTFRQWVGAGLGFLGILVLIEFDLAGVVSSGWVGVGTMLLAALCYAFAAQSTKRFLSDVPIVFISIGSLMTGAIASACMVALTTPIQWEELGDVKGILSIIGLGCLGSGVAYLLFYFLAIKGSPNFAASVTYVVPITAIFWGALLLNEPITEHIFIGLGCIAMGVYFSGKKKPLKA
ncbi:DMT family transporter [Aureibacillus halotolerans]|uniref:Drug/metabolite transporter (DMT)-like permease n=1 Tax=Aureibacillus halotolerans TaxID=1508390 RepID=A0A4R6U884_9BACI|nr:DMT family transporter [Aureibacillus halotolerans]TDQ42591.1 drug/metabolite transporter (DMT)-like permease [Aureibacillus halotolerans]